MGEDPVYFHLFCLPAGYGCQNCNYHVINPLLCVSALTCRGQCWCGDASTDYAKHGDTTCTYLCAGDSSEICGGKNAMSVYEYEDGPSPTPTAPTPTPPSGFIGCYADSNAGRIMVLEAVQDDMTAEVRQPGCSISGPLLFLPLRVKR